MKDIKNIYNYELDKMKVILINEKGDIVGGFEENISILKKGSEYTFEHGQKIKILQSKKILIVKDI